MRRALAVVAAAVGLVWLLDHSRAGCVLRGQHEPRRAGAMGGFRCSRCGKAGGSLSDFNEPGFVDPLRRTYSRDAAGGHQETTRSAEWGS